MDFQGTIFYREISDISAILYLKKKLAVIPKFPFNKDRFILYCLSKNIIINSHKLKKENKCNHFFLELYNNRQNKHKM